MGFEISKRTVLWEGIVFPGIEFGDPRFEIFTAKPRASLKKYLHIAWFFKWNIPGTEEIPVISVPTPCFKIGARFGENTFQVYGPRTQGSIGKLSGHGISLGFDLVPGGFFPFSGKSSSILTDGAFPIADFLPEFPLLVDQPWSIDAADEWFQKTQDFLETVQPLENSLEKTNRFFQDLWTEPDSPSLKDISDQFEISKRSVQRVFQNEIGMSPKTAIRITRLQKGLKAINRLDVETLARAAMDSGFFDQPHMVREFRRLVKKSPTQLKRFL